MAIKITKKVFGIYIKIQEKRMKTPKIFLASSLQFRRYFIIAEILFYGNHYFA